MKVRRLVTGMNLVAPLGRANAVRTTGDNAVIIVAVAGAAMTDENHRLLIIINIDAIIIIEIMIEIMIDDLREAKIIATVLGTVIIVRTNTTTT